MRYDAETEHIAERRQTSPYQFQSINFSLSPITATRWIEISNLLASRSQSLRISNSRNLFIIHSHLCVRVSQIFCSNFCSFAFRFYFYIRNVMHTIWCDCERMSCVLSKCESVLWREFFFSREWKLAEKLQISPRWQVSDDMSCRWGNMFSSTSSLSTCKLDSMTFARSMTSFKFASPSMTQIRKITSA